VRRGGLGVKTPRTEYYIVVKLYWYVETGNASDMLPRRGRLLCPSPKDQREKIYRQFLHF
jgi:hypothetical protein